MELTGDTMDIKPISKRQLRRRVHDTGGAASGYGDKGGRGRGGNGGNGGGANGSGKPVSMVNINFLLDDSEVHDDLKIINKNMRAFQPGSKAAGAGASGSEGPGGGCGNASSASTSSGGGPAGASGYNHRDTRIEEGKLFYEKRWFRRGQSVQVWVNPLGTEKCCFALCQTWN